jgi:hypothetical protein
VLASGFDESVGGATSGTRATGRRLLGCPAFNVRPEPDLDAAVAEVEDRPWHVQVPVLVDADGVAVGEAQELSYAVGVDEIVDVDSLTHAL